jgi:hypothetical protein
MILVSGPGWRIMNGELGSLRFLYAHLQQGGRGAHYIIGREGKRETDRDNIRNNSKDDKYR